MPVIDHEIHPSTQFGNEFRYGCWNKDRPNVGDIVTGSEYYGKQTWLYVFSTECRNDSSLTDQACSGCKWAGSGEKYAEYVQRNSTLQ